MKGVRLVAGAVAGLEAILLYFDRHAPHVANRFTDAVASAWGELVMG